MTMQTSHDALKTAMNMLQPCTAEEMPQRLQEAKEAAESLASGEFLKGLQEAHRVMDEALFEDGQAHEWAAVLLRLRLALEWESHRHADEELDEILDRADAACEKYQDGLLLLEEEDYDSIVDGDDVDPVTWWGMPLRIREVDVDGPLLALAREKNPDVTIVEDSWGRSYFFPGEVSEDRAESLLEDAEFVFKNLYRMSDEWLGDRHTAPYEYVGETEPQWLWDHEGDPLPERLERLALLMARMPDPGVGRLYSGWIWVELFPESVEEFLKVLRGERGVNFLDPAYRG